MKKLRDKLKSVRGFSISELMVCLLILMLATGVGTHVISSGIDHYQENSRNSQAITLGNTIAVAVRDQLAFATAIGNELDGKYPEFVSNANTLGNVPCRIWSADKNGATGTGGWGYVIWQYRVEQVDGSNKTFEYYPVSVSEYEKGIYDLVARVTYDYADGVFNVTVEVSDNNSLLGSDSMRSETNRNVLFEKKFSVEPVSNTVAEEL